jgi:18S rRNA (guanine1575-N7)-methyltransferase
MLQISAIQWLCNADKSSHNPWKRLNTFFKSLYPQHIGNRDDFNTVMLIISIHHNILTNSDNERFACLSRGSKAVLQFYPENAQQMEMISTAAMRCGFTGGLLVLCLKSNNKI